MPGSDDQSDLSEWTFLINVKILFATWLVWPDSSDSWKAPSSLRFRHSMVYKWPHESIWMLIMTSEIWKTFTWATEKIRFWVDFKTRYIFSRKLELCLQRLRERCQVWSKIKHLKHVTLTKPVYTWECATHCAKPWSKLFILSTGWNHLMRWFKCAPNKQIRDGGWKNPVGR